MAKGFDRDESCSGSGAMVCKEMPRRQKSAPGLNPHRAEVLTRDAGNRRASQDDPTLVILGDYAL